MISVPHLSFTVKDRTVWVDGHFPAYMENRVRLAALVRVSVDPKPIGKVLKLEITAKDLHQMFVDVLGEAKDELMRLRIARGSKMGRWTLSRALFAITGHFKKILEDEKTAITERDLRDAVEILEKLAESKPCKDIGYLNVEVKNGVVCDEIYRKLAEVDAGFRRRLQEVTQ